MHVVRLMLMLALPAALTAQTVRGRVVNVAKGGAPIARAVVKLSSGTWSGQALTGPSGSFAIAGNGPGSYNLRIAAIGFTPTTRSRMVLSAEPLELGDIGLAHQVFTLEEIGVQSNAACTPGSGGTTVLGRLLDGARTSLEVMEATLPTMRGGFQVERITRRALAGRRDSLVVADTTRSIFSSWPIASVGSDSLRRFGFVLEGLGNGSFDRRWFGPDVAVLFSDWFLAAHCFKVGAPASPGAPIVVTYEPAGKPAMVDIGGQLTLDPATLALTSMSFEHRHLPNGMRDGLAGGELEFAQLPSGIWLPMRWSIHAPIQNTRGAIAGSSRHSGQVIGYESKLPETRVARRPTARPGPFSVPRRVLGPPDSLPDTTPYRAALGFACPLAPTTRTELFKIEELAADRAGQTPDDAAAWHALACARAHLDIDGAIGRESREMPPGSSWQEGAINAELQALIYQPDRSESAELLAVLMLDQPEPKPAAAIRSALARAVTDGVAAPAAVRGCVTLSIQLGDVAAAHRCIEIGLEGGADSTWQLIMLTRLTARTADTALVSARFDGALGTAHDAAAWKEVGWHLHWLLNPEEWQEWLALDDARRGGWVRDRLASRDIRDGKPAGARLVEHFHRLDYAEEHFRFTPRRDQRGRFLVAASPDNRMGYDWVAKFGKPGLIPAAPWRFHKRFDYHLDDRGAVWLRWGAPLERIPWTGSDFIVCGPGGPPSPPAGMEYAADARRQCGSIVNTREAWVYEVDGQRLFLNFESEQFDGSMEPTRLVGGVLGLYMCEIDNYRCVLANRSANGGAMPAISPEQVSSLRQVDYENIREATTKDDNSVRPAHHIGTVATLSRVWDPASGATLAVLPYALRRGDLRADPDSHTATIDLVVRQWDPITTEWQNTDITRRVRFPSEGDPDAHVTGFLVVPSSDGVAAWSLVAGQEPDRLGRAFMERLPPLGSGPLAISDLVLGAASQGQEWHTPGGRTVALGPLGAYDRSQPVAVYWQTDSERARVRVRTTIRLLQADRTGGHRVVLELATEGEMARGYTEVQREVGVAQLDPGSYRLEVELTDLADGASVKRSTRLLLR